MKYETIKTFNEIQISNPSLLVFDIDETILYYKSIKHDWWKNISDSHFYILGDRFKADMLTYVSWYNEICKSIPLHTDEIGMKNLLVRSKEHKCKIIFITARKEDSHEITVKHLNELGIEHDEIYYTNMVGNKGEVLNKIICDKYPDYNEYVFVDDLENNLLQVKEHISKEVICYKFVRMPNDLGI